MKKIRNQKGFTLIELVLVIVVLGILAAVAVPRFITLTTAARTASVNGMAGAVRSAVSLASNASLRRLFSARNDVTTTATGVVTACCSSMLSSVRDADDRAVAANSN